MHGTSATRCEVSLEKNIILHFLITAMRFTDLIKDLLLRETRFFLLPTHPGFVYCKIRLSSRDAMAMLSYATKKK